MKRALVLGIGGQDGSYIAELLLERGYKVHGLHRRSSVDNLWRIAHVRDKVTLHPGDLTDPASLQRAWKEADPDEVYNLADQDHVGWSRNVPGYSAAVTYGAVGTLLELLAAVRTPGVIHKQVKFFQPISSTVFGEVDGMVSEDTQLAPDSPYACAKAAAWLLCKHYRREHGLHICCGVMFNHDSPRRGPDYLLQKIARGVVEVANGKRTTLDLWSLEGWVDIGHAREYMEAVHRMMTRDKSLDYLVATGKLITVRELVQVALVLVGLKGEPEDYYVPSEIECRLVKPPLRPVRTAACLERTRSVLGFEPKLDAAKVLEELVNYHRVKTCV